MSKSNKLMLIIGIDSYESLDLDSLPSCKKDAQDIAALLSKLGFVNYQESPIIGSEIIRDPYSWAKLREVIFKFFNQATPRQTLLFYFSGHGVLGGGDVFLGSPQVDPDEPSIKGFSLSDLRKCMGVSKSQRIIGIIDSCYSGAADLPNSEDKQKSAVDNAKKADAAFEKIEKETEETGGGCLLLSSQSYEESNAIENSNSLYTKYLLEGLRGVKDSKDENGETFPGSIDQYGKVTPQSLQKYLFWTIGELPHGQSPRAKIDPESEIILASYPGLIESADKSKVLEEFSKLAQVADEEIVQKANKIKEECNKFFTLRKTLLEKGAKDELEEEIKKTGKTLKDIYSRSEGIRVSSIFARNQLTKGEITQDNYQGKISKFVKEIAEIEFEFEECQSLELANLKSQVSLILEKQGIPATLPEIGKERRFQVSDKEKKQVETIAKTLDELDSTVVKKKQSKSDAETYNRLGVFNLDSKKWDKAREYFEKALEIDSKNRAAWKNLIEVYVRSGDYSQGIQYFKRIKEIQPENEWTDIGLGRMYFALEDYQQAIDFNEKALETNPENFQAWLNLGAIYEEKEDFKSAKNCYNEVRKINPEDDEAWKIIGSGYNQIDDDNKRAIECYKRALEINPKNEWTWMTLGEIYAPYTASPDELKPAIECYQKALEINPKKWEYAWKFLLRIFGQTEDFKQGTSYYESQVKTNPNNEWAWISLGGIFWAAKGFDSAKRYFEKAVEINPRNEGTLIAIGSFFSSMGDYKKAEQYYMRAVEINPRNEEVYETIGENYRDIGHYKKAIEWYKKLLKLNPKEETYIALGEIGYDYERYRTAIGYFEKALEINPKKWHTLFGLGRSYGGLGKFSQAISFFKEALDIIQKDPQRNVRKHSITLCSLGLAYYELKEYKNAIDNFQKSLELRPFWGGAASIWEAMGKAFDKLGNHQEAKKCYQKMKEKK